jgi:hypothetical protein
MKPHISEIVQKEVTRKEFLKIAGFGIMSVMGIGSIVKLLGEKNSPLKRNTVSSGYGSSAYGK